MSCADAVRELVHMSFVWGRWGRWGQADGLLAEGQSRNHALCFWIWKEKEGREVEEGVVGAATSFSSIPLRSTTSFPVFLLLLFLLLLLLLLLHLLLLPPQAHEGMLLLSFSSPITHRFYNVLKTWQYFWSFSFGFCDFSAEKKSWSESEFLY